MSGIKVSSGAMFVTRSLGKIRGSLIGVYVRRSFSTTASLAARPRPHPALRGTARVAATPRYEIPVEAKLPPLSLLKLAKKAGVLDIEPERALSVLRDFSEICVQRKPGPWLNQFCTEENVTPRTIALLAVILLKCLEQPRKALAVELLLSTSAIGMPFATITLLSTALKENKLKEPRLAGSLAHLRTLARPPHSNINAIVLLGRIHESHGDDTTALRLYQQAISSTPPFIAQGEKENDSDPHLPLPPPGAGIAAALIQKGFILQHRRRDPSGALAAFRAAAFSHDDPRAYYQLALLDDALPPATCEEYLLKAAASGIIDAASALATLYDESGREKEHGEKKEQQQQQHTQKLAREWYYLGATAGQYDCMFGLAGLLSSEGKVREALTWVEMAERSESQVVLDRAKRVRLDIAGDDSAG